jgi:UDP-N-acetylglucosamine 2-epimerase (non-hydrolysing)
VNTGMTVKLLHVVGTRPNFMKAAAVMTAVDRWNRAARTDGGLFRPRINQILVHTGQHYDEKMSRVFFEDLGLPRPNHYLGVGSGSHAEQTAKVMIALEPVLTAEQPDLVITVGDVNSTLAAALVAAKMGIPVAHVEAGLRSRDRTMPEEINRLVVDQLSDLLFTTSRDADANLAAEGVSTERIHFVGNTMIDTLKSHLPRALESPVVERAGLTRGEYAVVTLHRPSNVDGRQGLEQLVLTLNQVARKIPVVFPIHARTRARFAEFGLDTSFGNGPSIVLSDPLGYLDFLCLMAGARLVLTDSGGIQEETTFLNVPCLTLRKNTERPVTITEGTNRLVDPENVEAVVAAVDEALASPLPPERCPEYWDGHAGDRIVQVIVGWRASGHR